MPLLQPLTPNSLLSLLHSHSIPFQLHSHPPVFTSTEAHILKHIPGAHVKNLLLKSSNQFILITLRDNHRIPFKSLSTLTNLPKPTFASPDDVLHLLGVPIGHVSPFCLLHPNATQVIPFIDDSLLTTPTLNVHPLINSQTLSLTPTHLLSFLQSFNIHLTPIAPIT